jgi:hypothetical protein
MITGCTVGGRVPARVCVLSFRTRQSRIDACVEGVAAEAPAMLVTSIGVSPIQPTASTGLDQRRA